MSYNVSNQKLEIIGQVVDKDNKGIPDLFVEVWDAGIKEEEDEEIYNYPLGSQMTKNDGTFNIKISKSTIDKLSEKLHREVTFSFKIYDGKKHKFSFRTQLLRDTRDTWNWTRKMSGTMIKIKLDETEYRQKKGFANWFDNLLDEVADNLDEITEDFLFIMDSAMASTLTTIDSRLSSGHGITIDDVRKEFTRQVRNDEKVKELISTYHKDPRQLSSELEDKLVEDMIYNLTVQKGVRDSGAFYHQIDDQIISEFILDEDKQKVANQKVRDIIKQVGINNSELILEKLRTELIEKMVILPSNMLKAEGILGEIIGFDSIDLLQKRILQLLPEDYKKPAENYIYTLRDKDEVYLIEKFRHEFLREKVRPVDQELANQIEIILDNYSTVNIVDQFQTVFVNNFVHQNDRMVINQITDSIKSENPADMVRILKERIVDKFVTPNQISVANLFLDQLLYLNIIREIKRKIIFDFVVKAHIDESMKILNSNINEPIDVIASTVRSDIIENFVSQAKQPDAIRKLKELTSHHLASRTKPPEDQTKEETDSVSDKEIIGEDSPLNIQKENLELLDEIIAESTTKPEKPKSEDEILDTPDQSSEKTSQLPKMTDLEFIELFFKVAENPSVDGGVGRVSLQSLKDVSPLNLEEVSSLTKRLVLEGKISNYIHHDSGTIDDAADDIYILEPSIMEERRKREKEAKKQQKRVPIGKQKTAKQEDESVDTAEFVKLFYKAAENPSLDNERGKLSLRSLCDITDLEPEMALKLAKQLILNEEISGYRHLDLNTEHDILDDIFVSDDLWQRLQNQEDDETQTELADETSQTTDQEESEGTTETTTTESHTKIDTITSQDDTDTEGEVEVEELSEIVFFNEEYKATNKYPPFFHINIWGKHKDHLSNYVADKKLKWLCDQLFKIISGSTDLEIDRIDPKEAKILIIDIAVSTFKFGYLLAEEIRNYFITDNPGKIPTFDNILNAMQEIIDKRNVNSQLVQAIHNVIDFAKNGGVGDPLTSDVMIRYHILTGVIFGDIEHDQYPDLSQINDDIPNRIVLTKNFLTVSSYLEKTFLKMVEDR